MKAEGDPRLSLMRSLVSSYSHRLHTETDIIGL